MRYLTIYLQALAGAASLLASSLLHRWDTWGEYYYVNMLLCQYVNTSSLSHRNKTLSQPLTTDLTNAAVTLANIFFVKGKRMIWSSKYSQVWIFL